MTLESTDRTLPLPGDGWSEDVAGGRARVLSVCASPVETLAFPALEIVGSRLTLVDLPNLEDVSLPALHTVGERTKVSETPGLTRLELGKWFDAAEVDLGAGVQVIRSS